MRQRKGNKMNENLANKKILVTRKVVNEGECFHALMFTDELGRIVRINDETSIYVGNQKTISYLQDTDKIIRKIEPSSITENFYDENNKLTKSKFTETTRSGSLYLNYMDTEFNELERPIRMIKHSVDSQDSENKEALIETLYDIKIDGDKYSFEIDGFKVTGEFYPNSPNKKSEIVIGEDGNELSHMIYRDNDLGQVLEESVTGAKHIQYEFDENDLMTKMTLTVGGNDHPTLLFTTTYINYIIGGSPIIRNPQIQTREPRDCNCGHVHTGEQSCGCNHNH
jgi:hypothetical protein